MKTGYTFLFVLFIVGSLTGQTLSSFSTTHKEYFDQLEEFMTASKRKVMEDQYDEFKKVVSSEYFTTEEVDSVISLSNKMLSFKMRSSPFFSNFLDVLMRVKKSDNGPERFESWMNVYRQLLANIENRNTLPIKNFLSFSRDLFEFNAVRYSKLGTTWLSDTPEYTFEFDEAGQLIVRFEALNLVSYRKKDTIRILETAGICYPLENKWIGEKGRVQWNDRFDLDQEVFAEFGAYEIDLTKALYEIDTVTLTFPQFFPGKTIEGSFSDKLTAQNKATEGSYPKFESFDKDLKIENIGGGVRYKGGFRLNGITAYGYGTEEEKAVTWINNKANEPIFKGLSEWFVIRKDNRIAGENVETTMYFADDDSLYHPAINMRFEIPDKKLSLSRGKRGSNRNPLYNSFHNMIISVEKLDWYIDKDTMLIGSKLLGVGTSDKEVIFESLHFFDQSDYYRIQNIGTTNPISRLKQIADKEGSRTLYADDVAIQLNPKFQRSMIQSLLYDLVSQGFVNYDDDKGLVEVKDKIYHYSDASAEKVDYDKLRLISESDETNAVFDVKNRVIEASGVKRIEFSTPQKVAARPSERKVRILENRGLDFGGRMFAGFSHLTGDDFHFDYDNFHVELDSLHFFDLFVPTGQVDENDEPIALSIASRIEGINGFLLIDAPNNKSGLEDIPLFPSMESKDSSYVYYDSEETQGGAYGRDSFYFELYPFSFNHLDDYAEEDVTFDGRLVSADIFPPFEETIRIMPEDQSLGFVTSTPDDGFGTYNEKGQYIGDLTLSNAGFQGKGNLSYLSASVDSEDILFKPDQMTASAELFNMEEDRESEIEVPQVRGIDVSIDWRPYRDSMYVNSKEAPFKLYKEGLHTLEGTLILTPGGLKGRGLFDFDMGSMRSKLFSFGAFSVESDTMDLTIRTIGSEDLAFDTKNVSGRVDFDEKLGSFKGNSTGFTTYMPHNQYVTNLNDFDWDLEKNTITFLSQEGEYGTFISIHPDQDSLTFKGKTAFYDLNAANLEIGGVPVIRSADALIYTKDGDVTIEPKGIMTTLDSCRIICDTINKYHVIEQATVDVMGRKLYEAKGFYQYDVGVHDQQIWFDHIVGQRVRKGERSEKATETRAQGEATEEDSFYIDHKTKFAGFIQLKANSKNLSFKGFAKLDAPKLARTDWFTVSFEGDKNNLVVAYDQPKNYNGTPLETGFFISKETAGIYAPIMTPLYFRKDRRLLPTSGLMRYDQKTDHFIFGDSLKVLGESTRGNLFTYKNSTGELVGEGRLGLGSGLDAVKVLAAGRIYGDRSLVRDTLTYSEEAGPKVKADAMVGIDLIIPEKLLKIIQNDIESYSFDASDINYNRDRFYTTALSEFIDDDKIWKEAADKMLLGQFVVPPKYNQHSFLFSKIPLVWNPEYQSFVSTEDKLGLISINGQVLHRKLTAYVEFKMPTNEDDRIYIYLRSPGGNFYFFGYKQGVLNVVSNNTKFNDEVEGLKGKERTAKLENGETYEIALVNTGTADMFVRRVKDARQ